VTAWSTRDIGALRPSAARGLEGGGGHLVELVPEVVLVCSEALEGSGEVGLHGHFDRATRCDDAARERPGVRRGTRAEVRPSTVSQRRIAVQAARRRAYRTEWHRERGL
jgi:hypothetical protein